MIAMAIDTANEFGSLALSYGDETLEEVPMHAPGGFSAVLFEQIETLLQRNSLDLKDVDLYAASIGPGSFTGVRIGLTAAKAMAEVNAKPCFGVSNLAAMANFGTDACRAVLLDARRSEVYGGVFGSHPVAETVEPLASWLDSLPACTTEFLAFDFAPFEAALETSRFRAAMRTQVSRAIAAAMAELAVGRFRMGEKGDPALIDANYVRRSDAELLWKERA